MTDFSLKLESKKLHRRLAVYLKNMRNESGFTMRELASLIHLPHSYIGKIEHQGRRMDVGEFIHYCRALKRDPANELQTFLKNPPPIEH